MSSGDVDPALILDVFDRGRMIGRVVKDGAGMKAMSSIDGERQTVVLSGMAPEQGRSMMWITVSNHIVY